MAIGLYRKFKLLVCMVLPYRQATCINPDMVLTRRFNRCRIHGNPTVLNGSAVCETGFNVG